LSFLKPRRFLCFFLLLVLGSMAILPGDAFSLEGEIDSTEEDLSRIEEQIESQEEQLSEYESEEERLIGELRSLEDSLSELRGELEQLEKEIKDTEEQITFTEEQLAEAEAEIAHRDELLSRRLRAIYEQGDNGNGYLEVVFNASSFAEFITRLNDLQIIAENDLEILEEAFIARNEVQEKKEELETQKESLLALRVERMERREELSIQLSRQEQLREEVRKSIEAQEQAIEELEQEAEKVGEEIKRLQEEMQRQTEHLVPSGDLLWPLAEYGTSSITSGFGPRTHPITGRAGVFHGGVDIGIPRTRWPGSPSYNGNPVHIRAAEHGVVIFAGISGSLSHGYGRMVIVDHGQTEDGQGMVTVYAHCHNILVSEKQEVARGKPLAIVGSTGSSTGPHLHFEVRIDGTRENPMNFF